MIDETEQKFEKFTKVKEIIEKVESEFGKELAHKLNGCFLRELLLNLDLTEDELIEKVLNDIKKDEQ